MTAQHKYWYDAEEMLEEEVSRHARTLAHCEELAAALRDTLNIIRICKLRGEPTEYPADCPYEPTTEGMRLWRAGAVLAKWDAR